MVKRLRLPLLMMVDTTLILSALFLAYCLRFQVWFVPSAYRVEFLELGLLYVGVFVGIFYLLRLYHRIWAYSSTNELVAIIQGVIAGSLIVVTVAVMVGIDFPRSIPILMWAFGILFIGGSRFGWRLYREQVGRKLKQNDNGHQNGVAHNSLIVGAGAAGSLVAKELMNNGVGVKPIGFVDDDPNKRNLQLMGLPVLGNRQEIPRLVKEYRVKEVIIAMPSMPGEAIREIVQICRAAGVRTMILPGVYQLISGEVSVNKIRPVQVEDILRREPVRVDLAQIANYLRGKVVLVTGAGGSIGSELCRQIATLQPQSLILLDNYENTTNDLFVELRDADSGLSIRVEIADIREQVRIDAVFQQYRPDVVFHAAAHKHVPLMEYSPTEAIRTNVFGTRKVAQAALNAGVDTFILISTDKAVNPTSVMGATKRLAEVLIQHMNGRGATRFAAVRFGNVLDSDGSVVPLFKRQIEAGGPVTVTHPEMTRYFMTILEAVQLVIQAGAMAEGGEVFVLDMGEPVKILDLATDLIRLSGLEPGKDIQVNFIGVRPGEKLYEELLTAEEGTNATRHRRIFTARPTLVDAGSLERQLAHLWKKGPFCTREDVFQALSRVVPGAVKGRSGMKLIREEPDSTAVQKETATSGELEPR
ncbi:MAG: polysaccharide biosynthesis protein [Candidatus Desulforudaceae bacterium]